MSWNHHLCCTGNTRVGYWRCVAKWSGFNMKKITEIFLSCRESHTDQLGSQASVPFLDWKVLCHCLCAQLARTEWAELSEMLCFWISAMELSIYQYLLFRKTCFQLSSWEINFQALSLNEWKRRPALLSTISNPHTKFRLQFLWAWKDELNYINWNNLVALPWKPFWNKSGNLFIFPVYVKQKIKDNRIQKYIIYGDRKRD